jgi:pimeloyl-ACP methyl ester carboxylesterase
VQDRRLRVCLERTIELAEVRLRLRDWPGLAGPLVHVPDPLVVDHGLVQALAEALTPGFRVLSLEPRGASPYQVDACDLLALLDQFGFATPVLIAEGLGCVAALLVAAWYTDRVAGLVLVEPVYAPPLADGVPARALRDCPPNWPSLRGAVQCAVLEVPRTAAVEDLERFLAQLAPGVT